MVAVEFEPHTRPPTQPSFARRHAAGLGCALAGITAVGLTAWLHFSGGHGLGEIPDPRLTVPFLVLTLALGVTSLVRREDSRVLPVAGVALAAGAAVIGITLVVSIIAAATLVIILVMSEML